MKISLKHLRTYCPSLPLDPVEARHLLDDVGVEVKRVTETEGDVHFTLELLANRGDHRCYFGVAREVVGRVGGPLELPQTASITTAPSSGEITVSVESEACLLYSATVLSIAEGANCMPNDVTFPFIAAGLEEVSPAVDATNLANLELGQPTHCFDAATIDGAITIRLSHAGERAWLLFQQAAIDVPPGTLVIADEKKILAIAGVIGCEESKVTSATRRIVLESAAFDPVSVRLASRALRIQTDASARFERGCDPSLAVAGGAARVTYLLETYAGAKRHGPTVVSGAWRNPGRRIELDLGRMSAFLARPFDETEARFRLERYGFGVQALAPGAGGAPRLEVAVPTGRLWDVESPQDLYEEVARSIGYNALPEVLPATPAGALPSLAERTREAVDRVVLGSGFYEVITDGFYSRKHRDDLCGGDESHPLYAHVEILNAVDGSFALLKNNCLAQALSAVDANLRFGTETVKFFEWTRTFHPNPAPPNGTCDERRRLWLLAYGSARPRSWAEAARPVDVWFFKGIVEELASELRQPLRVVAAPPDHPLARCLHPYRQAAIELEGRIVGVLGEVEARVVRSFGIKRVRPYYLELDADALALDDQITICYLPPPRPPSIRMLAFTLAERVQADDVRRSIQAAAPPWLEQISIVDSFAHEENGVPVRTITYSLEYNNDQTERSADTLNATTQELIKKVEQDLGERGVHLRTQ